MPVAILTDTYVFHIKNSIVNAENSPVPLEILTSFYRNTSTEIIVMREQENLTKTPLCTVSTG